MTAFDVIVPAHLLLDAGRPPREPATLQPEPRDRQADPEPPKEFVWPATNLPGIRVTD
jgi:hypothetical protein